MAKMNEHTLTVLSSLQGRNFRYSYSKNWNYGKERCSHGGCGWLSGLWEGKGELLHGAHGVCQAKPSGNKPNTMTDIEQNIFDASHEDSNRRDNFIMQSNGWKASHFGLSRVTPQLTEELILH